MQGLAAAQFIPPVPPDFLDFRRRQDGNLHFCLNMASALVEFDRALALALADTLLVQAEFHELYTLTPPTQPYEYRVIMSEPELYVGILGNCDAMVGAWLERTAVPVWLTVTRPYYSTRVVLAVADPDHAGIQDLPYGAAIGSRIAGIGSSQLQTWLNSQPAERTWRRIQYPENLYLVERLRDGTLAAVAIWEPAAWLAADGTPAEGGLHIRPLPFNPVPIEFGLALPTDAAYLQGMLDAAINMMLVDGTIDRLLEEFGLPPQARP